MVVVLVVVLILIVVVIFYNCKKGTEESTDITQSDAQQSAIHSRSCYNTDDNSVHQQTEEGVHVCTCVLVRVVYAISVNFLNKMQGWRNL